MNHGRLERLLLNRSCIGLGGQSISKDWAHDLGSVLRILAGLSKFSSCAVYPPVQHDLDIRLVKHEHAIEVDHHIDAEDCLQIVEQP